MMHAQLRMTATAPSTSSPSSLFPSPRSSTISAKLPPSRGSSASRRQPPTRSKVAAPLRSLTRTPVVVVAAVAADAVPAPDDQAPSTPTSRGGPPPPRPGALPFDTPLAIALAGAAFEAYNSPAGFSSDANKNNNDDFVDADGTRTRYLDAAVLSAASCGGVVAKIKVSRAAGLPASDAWGTSDPYFLAELKGRASAHQSAVVSRTCSPTFDDEFELYVGRKGLDSSSNDGNEEQDPLDAVLRVSFFDSDALTADDALGWAEVSLRELSEKAAASGGQEVELQLRAPGEEGGESSSSGSGGSGSGKSAGSVFLSGSVRTLSQPELESRASGSIAPDGTDEVARMSRAWRSLARAAAGGDSSSSAAADSIFEPAAFIENPASDTQLWIGVDSSTKRLMIAFRGTETTKIMDVLTDLNAVSTPIDVRASSPLPSPSPSSSPSSPSTSEPGALPLPGYARVAPRSAAQGGPPLAPMDRDSLWCHQGFMAAYRSVRCSVLRVVGECLAAAAAAASSCSSSSNGNSTATPWKLLFTGHSLGGALATLCAYEFAHLEFSDASGNGGIDRLIVYNFGSPRVGSGAFASHFDSSLPDCWRVVNAADLVPRVPRLLGYAHVGHAVPLKSDGTFDDEAIAENYAAGLYGDGDYAPVVGVGSSSVESPSPSLPVRKASFASPSASASEGIEPVFDEEGANVITAATALAQAAASALFGGGGAKKNENGGEGAGEESKTGGGYLTEKQAAADAVSKLISSEIRTMSDFLSGDAVSHHTEAVYLEVLRKAVDAAGDLARELEEESRGENEEGEVEAAAVKAAEAAQELIEEAQKS